jgi:hypothetical protein
MASPANACALPRCQFARAPSRISSASSASRPQVPTRQLRVSAGAKRNQRPRAPTAKPQAVAAPTPTPLPLSSHTFTPEEAAATFDLFVRKVVPPPPPPVPSLQVARDALMARTAAELRARCKALDLKGYGNKGQLVDRIVGSQPAPTAELLAAELEARRVARGLR